MSVIVYLHACQSVYQSIRHNGHHICIIIIIIIIIIIVVVVTIIIMSINTTS